MSFQLHVPVAQIIFRRPETTRRVVEAIAAARPPRLYVIADGPRTPEEAAQCAAARAVVEQAITWECDVITDYADRNLGLKRRVSSGLDRVFAQEEQVIVLEDDCVPDPTFFRFCQELLERYRDEPRVMHIGGNNFLPQVRIPDSYAFCRYPHIWGWATWRRAWQLYDVDMRAWTAAADKGPLLAPFTHPRERQFWQQMWDAVCAARIDTWDYQWTFACVSHGGLAIMPAVNLVSNIGFGQDASHTVYHDPRLMVAAAPMTFPLRHPQAIASHAGLDAHTARLHFMVPTRAHVLRRAIKRQLGRLRRAILRRRA